MSLPEAQFVSTNSSVPQPLLLGDKDNQDAHGLSIKDQTSILCLRMLTHCKESGIKPIHVSMRTTVPMNMSSMQWCLARAYGAVGQGFKPWRGLIQGGQTLVDLTPMRLFCSKARGPNI